MNDMNQNGPTDKLLNALASFAASAPAELNAEAERAAKAAVVDVIAVALGALPHRPAQLARRYARHAKVDNGATVWGTGERVTVETAALVNGVPLRGFDYNDFYFAKSAGHPSDIVPGLIALAEWRNLSGKRVLQALAVGYEVAINLFDAFEIEAYGWDYPMLTAIAGSCAVSRLLGLTEAQTREALAITVIPHFASDEVESNELNSRGDLTMWKRFNGSNAIRQAVFAGLLAEEGVEGVVRPFEGKRGFLAKFPAAPAELSQLFARLIPGKPLTRVTEARFKRWPVGSRGQSAIQAALEAHAGIKDVSRIKKVAIFSDEMAYDHLVRQRSDPWHPDSRETADHSLPFIVTTALLDGYVKVASFDVVNVRHPTKQDFLNDKVTIEISTELSLGAKGGFPTRVEVTDVDGQVLVGLGKAPPGHPLQPFSSADFEAKFLENVAPLYGEATSKDLLKTIWSFEELHNMDGFVAKLVLVDRTKIESPESTIQ